MVTSHRLEKRVDDSHQWCDHEEEGKKCSLETHTSLVLCFLEIAGVFKPHGLLIRCYILWQIKLVKLFCSSLASCMNQAAHVQVIALICGVERGLHNQWTPYTLNRYHHVMNHCLRPYSCFLYLFPVSFSNLWFFPVHTNTSAAARCSSCRFLPSI